MNLDKKNMKKLMYIVAFGIILYWSLNNLALFGSILSKLWYLFLPFTLGAVIAFILNIPTTKLENWFRKCFDENSGFPARAVSIAISLFIFLSVVMLICFLLIPELIENIQLLVEVIPNMFKDIQDWLLDLLDSYPDLQEKIVETFNDSATINNIFVNVLNYVVNSFFSIISAVFSGLVTIVTALVFAIYVISQKEYLARGSKKMLFAYTKENVANKVIEIASLANKTFANFISGQCVEAIILGSIFFIALSVLKIPYALIISVLIAFTALIPMFGTMIAAVVGFILIAVVDVFQAILFVIVFIIIQQVENNLIYPKVVGKSVGLSAMWTLLAVMVGGSIMGVAGMVIGLPLASIVYAILRSETNDIIKKKKIKV